MNEGEIIIFLLKQPLSNIENDESDISQRVDLEKVINIVLKIKKIIYFGTILFLSLIHI